MEELPTLFPEYHPKPPHRKRTKKSFLYAVTKVDVAILLAVFECFFMTAEQLVRFRKLSENSLPKLREKLRILTGTKKQVPALPYLRRAFQARYDPHGSLPYVYYLDTPGLAVLEEYGVDPDLLGAYRKRLRKLKERNRLPMDIDHWLTINEFIIAAKQLEQYEPRVQLQSFVHDWQLKRTPIPVTLYKLTHTEKKLIEPSPAIEPDAVLDFLVDLGDRVAPRRVFLEIDMATHTSRDRFKKKIAGYCDFFATNTYGKLYDTVRNVTVLHASPEGEKRRNELHKWATEQFNSPVYLPSYYSDGTLTPSEQDMNRFHFAAIAPGSLDPQQTLLSPICYPLFPDRPVPQALIRLPQPIQRS